MLTKSTHSYIGRKPCGCFTAATVDNPDDPAFTARHVAEFVRAGLTIERVTVDYVRANFGCIHEVRHVNPDQLAFNFDT